MFIRDDANVCGTADHIYFCNHWVQPTVCCYGVGREKCRAFGKPRTVQRVTALSFFLVARTSTSCTVLVRTVRVLENTDL